MAYGALYSQRQKRALNIVWAAAGRYDFGPQFLAFHQNGEPDIYLNSIVGLVHRHYDYEKIANYIREKLAASLFSELFTELFWLGLEQAAYERELPQRPVLKDLRYDHAKRFLAEDASVDISLQQLMLRQELVHSLKCVRCREILGEQGSVMNPWDRRLYKALAFTGSMATEELIGAMENVIQSFFRGHWYNKPREVIHFTAGPLLMRLLRKFLPMTKGQGESYHRQLVLPTVAPVKGAGLKGLLAGRSQKGLTAEELTARYGESLFTAERRGEIMARLCQGLHRQVQLWFTSTNGEAQPENMAYYYQHQARFRTELRKLTGRLENALLVCHRRLELPARSGKLEAARLWRGVVLKDGRVFSAVEPAPQGNFSVMLLLDGSVSREGRQSIIACQAYLLAEAMEQAGIPVAVVSFFSQAGCTVLQRLKDFTEKSAQGIFAYKTQGWNRDGLALRAMPELWPDRGGGKLAFILTDSDPSDESPLPRQGLRAGTLYGGKRAWEDAHAAVKALGQQGIQVLALINSVLEAGLVAEAAQSIYGDDYVFLNDLRDLAQKVGERLERAIFAVHA